MVKSELNQRSGPPQYPMLMVSKSVEGLVVLMVKDRVGTVVSQGEGILGLGHHGLRWDMNFFTPYTGTITLSNV